MMICGHGGTGRRVTLRSLWAKPVEVQVFLTAPFFWNPFEGFFLYLFYLAWQLLFLVAKHGVFLILLFLLWVIFGILCENVSLRKSVLTVWLMFLINVCSLLPLLLNLLCWWFCASWLVLLREICFEGGWMAISCRFLFVYMFILGFCLLFKTGKRLIKLWNLIWFCRRRRDYEKKRQIA